MDPTALLSNVASSVLSAVELARFINEVKSTPTDVKTCFDLTTRVDADLQYLISLKIRHEKYLATVPETLSRLDHIIFGARESVLDVCGLLEGCRKEVYERGRIPFSNKMRWVLGDSSAFIRRTVNLQQQHAALNVEIAFLRQIDLLKPLERMATTTFENVELLSMARRKKSRNFEHGSVVTVSDLGPSDLGHSPVDPPDFEEIRPLALPTRVPHSVSSVSDTGLSGGSLTGPSSIQNFGQLTTQTLLIREPSNVSTVSALDPSIARSSRVEEQTPLPSPTRLSEESIGQIVAEEDTSYYDGIIPVVTESPREEQVGMEVVEPEDDDPEEAFYTDLRRQEEERHRRMASRRRPAR